MIRKAAKAKKRRENPDKPLTDRMLMFAREYVANDFVGKTAAINAGYSAATAEQQASRLLTNVKVRGEIARLVEERKQRLSIDADRLLMRWMTEYYADEAEVYNADGSFKSIHDMPLIWRQGLIAGVKVKQLFAGEGDQKKQIGNIIEVKFANRHERGLAIGKHINVQAFKEVHEHKLDDPTAELAKSLMGNRIMPRPQAALPAAPASQTKPK